MLKTAAPGCYLHIHVTTTHIVQSIRDVQVVYTNHPDFRHKILPLYSACVPHERNPSTIHSTRVALWLLVNLLLRPNSGGVDVCAVQGGGVCRGVGRSRAVPADNKQREFSLCYVSIFSGWQSLFTLNTRNNSNNRKATHRTSAYRCRVYTEYIPPFLASRSLIFIFGPAHM